MNMRRIPGIALIAALACSPAVHAQAYPSKPVRLVIAAAPGGGTDVLGRVFAQRLSERLGQPFIADNRGGGGGSIAADAVVKSAADGYTLLMTNDQLVANASFSGKQTYDVVRDLAPVGLMGRTPIVLGVNPNVPANSVSELIALIRANPGKYAFSSCGNGTPLHLAGELLNLSAKLDLAHIAYRGCAPALVDAVSGQVPLFFNMLGNALPFEKGGKVKLLGVASPQRLQGFPQLATIAEAGYPAFEAFPWYGILAPAGTPREVISRLNAEITAGVGTSEIADKLRSMQFVPFTSTPEQFADIVRNDLARWTQLVREAKLKAE